MRSWSETGVSADSAASDPRGQAPSDNVHHDGRSGRFDVAHHYRLGFEMHTFKVTTVTTVLR